MENKSHDNEHENVCVKILIKEANAGKLINFNEPKL